MLTCSEGATGWVNLPQATQILKKSYLVCTTDNFLILLKVSTAFSEGFVVFVDLLGNPSKDNGLAVKSNFSVHPRDPSFMQFAVPGPLFIEIPKSPAMFPRDLESMFQGLYYTSFKTTSKESQPMIAWEEAWIAHPDMAASSSSTSKETMPFCTIIWFLSSFLLCKSESLGSDSPY